MPKVTAKFDGPYTIFKKANKCGEQIVVVCPDHKVRIDAFLLGENYYSSCFDFAHRSGAINFVTGFLEMSPN